jgi:hypothetical protein
MTQATSECREIRIAFDPTFEQWYEVLIAVGWVKPGQRLGFIVNLVLYAAAGVVIYRSDYDWWFVYALMTAQMAWNICTWSVVVKRRFRRLWWNSHTQVLACTATLTEDFFSLESDAELTRAKWTSFSEFIETPRYFICLTGLMAYFVPKSAMNEIQTNAARDLFKEKVVSRVTDRKRGFELVQNAGKNQS